VIERGYILKARCIEESAVAHAPPHVREIWDYFLRRALYKDGRHLKRGQLSTSYQQIQDDLSWTIGWRRERYSRSQCQTAMKYLKKQDMIATRRTTRGLIVTICKYRYYQNPSNYENHDESRTKTIGDPSTPDTTGKKGKKENKKNTPPTPQGEIGGDHVPATLEDYDRKLKEERFKRIRSPEYRVKVEFWLNYRQSLKKAGPLTMHGLNLTMLNMVQVVQAGGNAATVGEWMASAAGDGWSGWFFPERLEKLKKAEGVGNKCTVPVPAYRTMAARIAAGEEIE